LAFAIVFFLGQSYLGILMENTRQSDTLALTHKVEQQVNAIQNALLKAESPLFTLSDILTVHALLALFGLGIAALVFHLVRGRTQIFMQAEKLERMNENLAVDIARRRQIEEQLHLAKDAAVAATKAKSEFLATMSHEIRTPMNGVHGMLQLLETTPLNAEQQDYVQTGSTALQNLLRLINDILDLSKIEAGKLDIAATPFAVSELCRSIPSIFKEQTITKGLTLDIEMATDVPEMVVADPSRIRQVLLNVVGNAVKFTEQGGIKVRISSDTTGVSTGSVRLDFEVGDTGIGISPDQLPDLFQPFRQGRGSLIRTHPGTGLGLSIVKRLVELMEGEVSLQSTLGTGTTVRFHVMAKLHAKIRPGGGAASEAPKNRTMPEAGVNLAILVAEDDETSRVMMSRLLEKMGCTVMHAGDGREALLLLAREDVDLILMDIQMPLMDGVEATRRIRTDPCLGDKSRVPIIAVTAFAMSGDRERFLAAGMDDYVAKPVNMAELKAALDRVGPHA